MAKLSISKEQAEAHRKYKRFSRFLGCILLVALVPTFSFTLFPFQDLFVPSLHWVIAGIGCGFICAVFYFKRYQYVDKGAAVLVFLCAFLIFTEVIGEPLAEWSGQKAEQRLIVRPAPAIYTRKTLDRHCVRSEAFVTYWPLSVYCLAKEDHAKLVHNRDTPVHFYTVKSPIGMVVKGYEPDSLRAGYTKIDGAAFKNCVNQKIDAAQKAQSDIIPATLSAAQECRESVEIEGHSPP